MKIKQEDGSEIEVFTADEMKAKVEEESKVAATKAVDEFKAANPDKSEELEKLQKDLKKKDEDLEAALADGGNDKQIERLRKERDEAREAAEKAGSDWKKEFDSFREEIVGGSKKDLLDRLSGGDDELRKKIELEFDNYKPTETSQAAIKERMEKAYQLATGDKPTPGILDGAASAGDRGAGGGVNASEKKNEQTDNGKAIAKVLGISEEDRKKKEEYDAYMGTKSV